MRFFYFILCFLISLVSALTADEMNAVNTFLSRTNDDNNNQDITTEEIVHDLAVGLGLHSSAQLLYKYSPDAHTAYLTMYDTLNYLEVSGFTTPPQKLRLKKVIKYFDQHLLQHL